VATFIFVKVGFDQFGGNFGACTDEKSHFWPKKVGKSPVLRTKSGQKKSGAFSENSTFLADLRKLGVEKPLKSPLAHFYFLFNCDKKF
jgi:hypothetical protein